MARQINPPGPPDPDKANPDEGEGEGASGQNPPNPPGPPDPGPAITPLTDDQMSELHKQFGENVTVLSVGKENVVITFTEVTKGDDGKDHSATVTRKVPRP